MPAPPRAGGMPLSLILTATASMAFGALVHYKAIRAPAGDLLPVLARQSAASLRRTIGVDAQWLQAAGDGQAAKTLFILIALFQEALKSNVVLGVRALSGDGTNSERLTNGLLASAAWHDHVLGDPIRQFRVRRVAQGWSASVLERGRADCGLARRSTRAGRICCAILLGAVVCPGPLERGGSRDNMCMLDECTDFGTTG